MDVNVNQVQLQVQLESVHVFAVEKLIAGPTRPALTVAVCRLLKISEARRGVYVDAHLMVEQRAESWLPLFYSFFF